MKFFVINDRGGARNNSPAMVWTDDMGIITDATPAYRWAIGRTWQSMQPWANTNDREWVVVSDEVRRLKILPRDAWTVGKGMFEQIIPISYTGLRILSILNQLGQKQIDELKSKRAREAFSQIGRLPGEPLALKLPDLKPSRNRSARQLKKLNKVLGHWVDPYTQRPTGAITREEYNVISGQYRRVLRDDLSQPNR